MRNWLRTLVPCVVMGCALLGLGCSSGNSGNSGTNGDAAIDAHTQMSPEERVHVTQADAEALIEPSAKTEKASVMGCALIAPRLAALAASPVLEQGTTDTGTTLAVLGAIGLLQEDDAAYFNPVCSLSLGHYLAVDERYKDFPGVADVVAEAGLSTYPSGWGGSLTSLVLAQVTEFGLIDSKFYLHRCPAGDFHDPEANTEELPAVEFDKYATPVMREVTGDIVCSNYDPDISNCQCTGSGSQTCATKGSLVDTIKSIVDANNLAVVSSLLYKNLNNLGLGKSFYQFSETADDAVPDVWAFGKDVRACRERGEYQGEACQLASSEMIVFGYIDNPSDPEQGVLVLRNSWGKAIGDAGNFYMTYEYANEALLSIAALAKILLDGTTIHKNTINLEFSPEAGNEVMELDQWTGMSRAPVVISGFRLIYGVAGDGEAPGGGSELGCSKGGATPCDCTNDTCGFTSDTLWMKSGRHETDTQDIADQFASSSEYHIPIMTHLPKDEEESTSFFANGAYPSLINFWFTAAVTFEVRNDDSVLTYITCQDMKFAQTSNSKVNGENFANTAGSSTLSMADDMNDIIADPEDPMNFVKLGIDVGESVVGVLEFLFDNDNFWFLSSPASGFGLAMNAIMPTGHGQKEASLTFKCPATNDHYYAVRVGNKKILGEGLSDDTFVIFAIQILEEKWTEDTDVTCTKQSHSVTCIENPKVKPDVDLCGISGNSYEDSAETHYGEGKSAIGCE